MVIPCRHLEDRATCVGRAHFPSRDGAALGRARATRVTQACVSHMRIGMPAIGFVGMGDGLG